MSKTILGNICGQIAKLGKLRGDPELAEFLDGIQRSLAQYDVQQIHSLPDICLL
jgi:hypothetical protein